MKKFNLEQELDQQKQTSLEDVQKIVQDSSRLLEATSKKEDRNILANLGMDKNLKVAEAARGINLERETFEDTFETKVFTIEEIENVAIEYNLRFLPSFRFTGDIDEDTASAIKRFSKINGLDLTEYSGRDRSSDGKKFHILAPASEFELEDRPVPPRPPRPRPVDPVLFYEVGEGKYALVHQWGNDFSPLRFVNSWRKRNAKNATVHRAISYFGVSLIILAAFGVSALAPMIGIAALMSLALTTIHGGIVSSWRSNGRNGRSIYAEDNWSSKFKH